MTIDSEEPSLESCNTTSEDDESSANRTLQNKSINISNSTSEGGGERNEDTQRRAMRKLYKFVMLKNVI